MAALDALLVAAFLALPPVLLAVGFWRWRPDRRAGRGRR